ncbi:MAG TPA: hypothetical protein VL201_03555, partial [Patescibacteria group bacterium]|nr:hypothetical protein [Patescibacteria group bacterium]
RIACSDDYKKVLVDNVKNVLEQQNDVQLLTIDGVRAIFPFGWGIVRAANTQPVISMRFESVTQEGLLEVKKRFYLLLKPYLGEKIDIIFKD